MLRVLFSLFLLLISTQNLFSQSLFLKSDRVDLLKLDASCELQHAEVFNGNYYRILVFTELPDHVEKERLSGLGIKILNYLPKNAFFAEIPQHILNPAAFSREISHVLRVESRYKLSEMLSRSEFPHWALFGEEQVELVATYYPTLQPEAFTHLIPGVILESNPAQHSLVLRVQINTLPSLYDLPFFRYFETIAPPGEPENLPGRADHRSNNLWTSYSGGLQYRGDGLKVMMQDDGFIGPHIDYTGRTDQSNCTACSSDDADNHGDHVGGTIMGAGNLDPKARGMAHGATLMVYNSSNSNYNLVHNLYTNEDVFITSKSYSDVCNGGYTSLTAQLDAQAHQYPSLIHVFSAGNSGADDCGYGAGAGWGNITGGHKSAKNVIAVGNLTAYDALNSSSSRGPATDGRIKPDISGVGTSVFSSISPNEYASFTGTSMSCPGVAGTITQLFDAYRDLNGGLNPDAGLMKATILNTADDLGNTGPDFKHGWGRINARKAFELIENNQFLIDSLNHGDIKQHQLSVPAGLSKLRVMVYWTDHEAVTNASIALVNDLNITLTDPSSTVYNPWLLDHTPNATILNTPASTGIDSLNNMEQVELINPASGTYTLDISGFSVPEGPQRYVLVYYFEEEKITVTYPIGGEGLKPSSSEVVRWDASDGIDPFTISFSEDDGASWSIVGTAPANQRYFSWPIPSGTLTGLGRIKVERNAVEGTSSAAFSVIDIPTGLTIEWACPDSLKLTWNAVSGAINYEASMLGLKYMDSLGSTANTSLVVPVPASADTWFSIKSHGPDNAIGERAIAIHKSPGEFGCIWSTPFSNFSIDCESAGEQYCFNLTENSVNTDASSSFTWYFPGGTPASANGPTAQVCYPAPGNYDVALVVANQAGSDSLYQSSFISVIPAPSLPYFEGFESYSSFMSNPSWSVSNPDLNAAFTISSSAALSGVKSARLNNYSQTGNFIDELISGPIDLSSLNSSDTLTLSFRYSYRKKNSINDEWLKVYVATNCLENWVQRKTMHGDQLSDIVSSSTWTPTVPEEWTTVHMTNITSTYFSGDFRMKFRFESDNGNNFYIDNINLYKGAPSDELVSLDENENGIEHLVLYPNPASDELNLQFFNAKGSNLSVSVLDLSGKIIQRHMLSAAYGNNIVVLDTSELKAGSYFLTLDDHGVKQVARFVIQ